MTNIKEILLMVVFMNAECSRVIDKHNQTVIIAEEYCDKIGICLEGTHIMCGYYNPIKEMGVSCTGTKNITMTTYFADYILKILNKIRSQAAKGTLVGLENLPRGYGIYRLEWDYELATFAQLWANQCLDDRDPCRSTKKFPDPHQLVGRTLFSEPQWISLTRGKDRLDPDGFSIDKVKYGIESILQFWYERHKTMILPGDIFGILQWSYEDMTTHNLLSILYGSTTHVGCGVSVYQQAYDNETSYIIYNVVRLVCNLSHRFSVHEMVYNTDPPTEVGYTSKCGCPPGYDEDEDCLCYESGRGLPYSCKYGLCGPRIVIVPIISIEDAPQYLHKNTSALKAVHPKETIHLNQEKHSRRFTSRSSPSIFTKSSIFQLPTKKIKLNKNKSHIIRKNTKPTKEKNDFPNLIDIKDRSNNNFDSHYTRNNKNTDLNNVINYNHGKTAYSYNSKESYNKLMNLLNKLEEEAKDMQLESNVKALVDKKIRQIYGTFVRKFNYDNENEMLSVYEDEFKTTQFRNRK